VASARLASPPRDVAGFDEVEEAAKGPPARRVHVAALRDRRTPFAPCFPLFPSEAHKPRVTVERTRRSVHGSRGPGRGPPSPPARRRAGKRGDAPKLLASKRWPAARSPQFASDAPRSRVAGAAARVHGERVVRHLRLPPVGRPMLQSESMVAKGDRAARRIRNQRGGALPASAEARAIHRRRRPGPRGGRTISPSARLLGDPRRRRNDATAAQPHAPRPPSTDAYARAARRPTTAEGRRRWFFEVDRVDSPLYVSYELVRSTRRRAPARPTRRCIRKNVSVWGRDTNMRRPL
jgi:hypothetical protein